MSRTWRPWPRHACGEPRPRRLPASPCSRALGLWAPSLMVGVNPQLCFYCLGVFSKEFQKAVRSREPEQSRVGWPHGVAGRGADAPRGWAAGGWRSLWEAARGSASRSGQACRVQMKALL